MTDHPDVLNEVLKNFYYYDPDELGEDAFKPLGDDEINEAKQQILAHYRSVEEIEAAIPKSYDRASKEEASIEDFNAMVGYNKALDDVRKALGLEG